MPFCWMDESREEQAHTGSVTREAEAEADVLERAALLRRLGYSQADAVHRCMGNIAWAFSVQGKPAITPARLRKIVTGVYKPAS